MVRAPEIVLAPLMLRKTPSLLMPLPLRRNGSATADVAEELQGGAGLEGVGTARSAERVAVLDPHGTVTRGDRQPPGERVRSGQRQKTRSGLRQGGTNGPADDAADEDVAGSRVPGLPAVQDDVVIDRLEVRRVVGDPAAADRELAAAERESAGRVVERETEDVPGDVDVGGRANVAGHHDVRRAVVGGHRVGIPVGGCGPVVVRGAAIPGLGVDAARGRPERPAPKPEGPRSRLDDDTSRLPPAPAFRRRRDSPRQAPAARASPRSTGPASIRERSRTWES